MGILRMASRVTPRNVIFPRRKSFKMRQFLSDVTMANLTTNDKTILEKLFKMESGYVLNFTDRTMEEFFRDDLDTDIYDEKFHYASGSKANRMRGFWQVADNRTVGKSILKLIDYIENQILLDNLNQADFPQKLIEKGKTIGSRLSGRMEPEVVSTGITEEELLRREFGDVPIGSLGLEGRITEVIEQRMDEIEKSLKAKAALGAIFLCGSTLEGILLGIASKNPKTFNTAKSSPKDKTGKVLCFPDWTLNDLINVASETDFVGQDVKKFSHALRGFRNYIHPFQQARERFNPDEHTARLCWQVLKIAIIEIAKSK